MFTFTAEQLKQFLFDAITYYACEPYMKLNPAAREDRQAAINYMMAQLEASQPKHLDEDEIFTDALNSNPPILCPYCGDELISIETEHKIWCMRCGYTSNNSLDNISPAELGLLPAA